MEGGIMRGVDFVSSIHVAEDAIGVVVGNILVFVGAGVGA